MYLNCHSYHSLRFGTIPTEELVEMAVTKGVRTLALTDINAVAGIYDFTKLCRAAGIRPIVGIEFRREGRLLFIGLARTQEGVGEMNRFLTSHNFSGEPLPDRAPEFAHVAVIYPLHSVGQLRENEYLGIRSEQLNQLYRLDLARQVARMVILQPVTVRSGEEYALHRVLRAVDRNVILTRLEDGDVCSPFDMMVDETELLARFKDYPQIVANTRSVADSCGFDFSFGTPRNRRHFTGNSTDDLALLTRLAAEGLQRRYGTDAAAAARVERELAVIDELGFSGYFLITWDIVRYSRSIGLAHVGRGSGANSIVSYCLGITDVCPISLDLYFERFLNSNRKSPPDFDIDWSWKHRDTILRYIFDRYGSDHVAFCGTNVEFKYRSIVREVGKVFGLPKVELDDLSAGRIDRGNPLVLEVHGYSEKLQRFPNQRSMHSCGILISDRPITDYSVLEMPPKGFPIVQFNMHVAEDVGFDKFDILSQRGLGTIEDTVRIIRANRGVEVDIHNTDMTTDEENCNRYLAVGRTIGCFYIESPAMRGLLRRLKCSDYRTLVAASSIIRPGVAQSGMMKEYIFRHNHPDHFEYLHESLREHLSETYGIMVYQEDVIKIAIHYGGLSAADGDILRRAMSGKGRSADAMRKLREDFFASCTAKGRPEQLSREIYRQIESFAGYSFCKAHSASYAVESYQSLYLKVHYPIEFMAAAINNGGGFYTLETYVHEARTSGATVHNPCVNMGGVQAVVVGSEIYLGFSHLKGMELGIGTQIVAERERNGQYRSLEDFIERLPVTAESVETLIFIGAFRFTGRQKNELLITARLMMSGHRNRERAPKLLSEPVREFVLPALQRSPFEDAFDEIELLSFPLSFTPFQLLKTSFRGDVMVSGLTAHHKKQVRMVGYLICRKHVPTKRGDMFFGTWIDVNGDFFDTAHFADSLAAYPFAGGGCYLLLGTVEVDYHFPTVTVHKMAKLPFIPDPRYSSSDEKRFEAVRNIHDAVSMTSRAPYPQEHEIGLPRKRML